MDLWNRPNEFVPERWIDSKLKDTGRDCAYMPFALEARNCVGQPLAQIMLRCLLARLVLRFEFSDESFEAAEGASPSHFTVVPPRYGVRSETKDPKVDYQL